jgi:magnesium transporter
MLNKFELDTKFIDDLKLLITEKDSVTIAKKLKEVHPADIADIIEQLSQPI